MIARAAHNRAHKSPTEPEHEPASQGEAAIVPAHAVPLVRFVFGAPRSGTTWLGKLIDSNSSVAYLHEPIHKGRGLLLHQAIGRVRERQAVEADFRNRVVAELAGAHVRFAQPPFFSKDFQRLPHFSAVAWVCERLMGVSAGRLAGLTDASRVRMVLVKDGLAPFSFALTQALDARALVVLRHPCAVVNSMLRGQKIGAMGVAPRQSLWNSEQRLLTHLGYCAADLEKLHDDEFEALRWLAWNQRVPEWTDGDRMKVVVYGKLVRETESVVNEVFSWIGLTVNAQTRAYLKQSAQSGADWFRRLLGPKKMYYSVSPRSLRPDLAWRTELSTESIRRVLNIVESFPLARYWPEQAA